MGRICLGGKARYCVYCELYSTVVRFWSLAQRLHEANFSLPPLFIDFSLYKKTLLFRNRQEGLVEGVWEWLF